MMRTATLSASLAIIALLAIACQDSNSHPTGPIKAGGPSFNREPENDTDDEDAGYLKLVSPIGAGQGVLRATRIPHPTAPGNFAVHIEVRLHHVKRNTTYVVQRAPETFAPPGVPAGFDVLTTTDGSCQRGLFIPPWSSLAPAPAPFLTFPDQGTGSPTIVTNSEGNGTADFVFAAPFPLPLFDVMFRVIESSAAPTSALASDCETLPLMP